MLIFSRVRPGAPLAVLAALIALPVHAEDGPDPQRDILVTGQRAQPVDGFPATIASVTADRIATTVNAVNVEDTIKYLPSLIVRKRHIGDTQAPLATRTSGLGSSARSLIYADGALLSALIGNNNGSASPRWGMVSPQEIASIDVLYGPFSAAYPGNSIGAVVNITTRMPDRLEASISAADSVEPFDQYATHGSFPAHQIGATLGNRWGRLSLFLSADRTVSDGQPLSFATTALSTKDGMGAPPASGAITALDRTGKSILVLGASGLEHQAQDQFKAKAALDLGAIELRYVGGLFIDRTRAHAESYLTDQDSGLPIYAGPVAIDGAAYTIGANAFDSGVYRHDERHWSHALSASGSGKAIDWQVIATRYRFDHDVQRAPTTALPGALAGGAGTITRMDGTGWDTLDAKAALRAVAGHVVSVGAHLDGVVLSSDRYATADWLTGDADTLTQRSAGKTRTAALWAQDAWTLAPPLTLTLGGRYEWWRAYDGVNLPAAAAQPALSAARFSPKASLAWTAGAGITMRASFGEAWRFPTVGELYQLVTSPVVAIPNPDLRPERALSEELAVERRDAHGSARLSMFNESVKDALISQLGPLNGTATLATFVQNVDRTRARGAELAIDRRDVLPRFDLSGSVTYADATTRADAAFPAAIGRRLPQVPRWKATLVGTWRASDAVSLTAAVRYASRMYGTLDNSDPVGETYQGFGRYLVTDLRAAFRVGSRYTLGLGVDNAGDDRYFLYHPFPQRTVHADFTWRL